MGVILVGTASWTDKSLIDSGWYAIEKPILDQLKAKHVTSLKTVEVFKRAGMEREYGAYAIMCTFTHSNVGTLKARHGSGNRATLYKPLPASTMKSFLGMTVDICKAAIGTLPAHSDISREETISAISSAENLWREAEALQSQARPRLPYS
jgi:hypothetical protein